jgi:hypothetical protein
MDEPKPHEMPKLPRGATWHAVWLLPLLVVLVALLVPWSDEPAPVFDGAKMKVAAERWQAAMARRQAASAAAAAAASGAVQVRVIPSEPQTKGKP